MSTVIDGSLSGDVVDRIQTNTKQLFIVRDEKSSGTDGGNFFNNAWRTRDLNTVNFNTIAGASLSSNQITLPSGTYVIRASAPAYGVDKHQAKFANITDSSDAVIGSSAVTLNSSNVNSSSFIESVITISSQKVFEVQHYGGTSRSNNGFGSDSGSGVIEVYTIINIEKIG
jgi:hypothetical protein